MDTYKDIQPYEYKLLPGQRVRITNPCGASITKTKTQILNELDGNSFRDLSAHERIMLNNALKQFDATPTWAE